MVPDISAIRGANAAPPMPTTPLSTASRRMAKRRNESLAVVVGMAVVAVMELPFNGWVIER